MIVLSKIDSINWEGLLLRGEDNYNKRNLTCQALTPNQIINTPSINNLIRATTLPVPNQQ
jgi:hypothetical protein